MVIPTLKLLLFHNRGLSVLLFNYFLMNVGFYLLIPFVAVHGTRDLGLSATAAGLVLAVCQFVQQGITILGGAFGDRIGYRPTLALGVMVRALGFAAFAIARDLPGLLLAATLAASRGVFFEPTSKAALAIGGGLGNLFGGALFDLALANERPALLWYGYGALGVLLALGLAQWGRAARVIVP